MPVDDGDERCTIVLQASNFRSAKTTDCEFWGSFSGNPLSFAVVIGGMDLPVVALGYRKTFGIFLQQQVGLEKQSFFVYHVTIV